MSDPTAVPQGVPDERVDALYGLPLDEFTPRRDELAAEMRKGGEREAASWVKALRKPSAAAWVTNQLARCRGREAKRLSKAGDALRDTHERVLAGDAGASELREAADEVGAAERELLAAAPGLLDRDGHAPTPATLEKAAATLRAVALDEEVRAAFAAGRLTREASASGFGPLGGAGASAPGRSAKGGKRQAAGKGKTGRSEAAAKPKVSAAARKELREARVEERTSARELAAAERELEHARREAEAVERRLDQARSEAEAARRRLEEATAATEDARSAAEAAAARAERAQAESER